MTTPTSLTEPLSHNWRINTSDIPAIELANALRGLAKVVGILDKDTKDVVFSTSSFNSHKHGIVAIDAAYALKKQPISVADFDVLTGLAVHEAGHTVIDSHRVAHTGDLDKQGINVSDDEITIAHVSAVGEDIYNDNYIRRHHPVPFRYIQRARRAYGADQKDINWARSMIAWTATVLYGKLPYDKTPPRVMQALAILMTYTSDLSSRDIRPVSREVIYQRIYNDLKPLIEGEQIRKKLSSKGAEVGDEHKETWEDNLQADNAEQEVFDRPEVKANEPPEKENAEEDASEPTAEGPDGEGSGIPSNEAPPEGPKGKTTPSENPAGDADDAEEDELGDSEEGEQDDKDVEAEPPRGVELLNSTHTPIDKKLRKAIKEAYESDAEDMTQDIQDILEEYEVDKSGLQERLGKGSLSVVWSRPNRKPNSAFDPNLYRQLVWVQQIRNTLGKEIYRAEPQGRVDAHRLYRAPIDGNAFKVTRRKPRKDLDLVLLLDASGSMNSDANSIYEAARALYKALPMANVVTYSAMGSNVDLQHVARKGEPFKSFECNGGTPSGMALLATAKMFPKSLIIHFTDGGSNTDLRPSDAFPIIAREFPEVQIVDIVQRGARVESTSPNVSRVNITSPNEFPEVLKKALRPWYQAA